MEWTEELTISPAQAGLVIIAAIGIYLVVVLYTRLAGQRSVAHFSTFDFVVSIAIGAVVGRVVLVRTNLAAGALGLGVLFLIQALVAHLRNHHGIGLVVDNPPLLLMARGRVLAENLRRARLSEADLRERLRAAGVTSRASVPAVILERNGTLSILRDGEPEPWLLGDVPEWQPLGTDGDAGG